MPFLVSALLALAAVATVLGGAFYLGLISPGTGTATASRTPRPSTSFVPSTTAPTVEPTAEPTATLQPSPTPIAPGGTYTVKPGDSLSLIGDKVGVPWTLIAEANGIEPPGYIVQVGQVLIIPVVPTFSPGGDTYIVQSGDTITGIANKVGVDPTDLADFNNIADWNSIQVGQVLYVPGPGWTPRPTSTPE
jgi:LysM repeat protein